MPRIARTLLLAVATAAFTLTAAAAAPDLSGRWEGAIRLPGQELAVQTDWTAAEEGWAASIDIPAQGIKGMDLAEIRVEGREVAFAIPGIPGEPRFEGELDPEAAGMEGTFTQGGQEHPFTLARSQEPTAREKALQALEGFDEWIEEAREAWEVPGIGVAVVQGGETIYAKGFGLRDVEQGLPVTPETLFAIGSTTKSFTALVLGTLVDEGKLDWREPVRTYMLDFALVDDVATEGMTALDLLNHRSGLPRHDLMWYGSDLSRREIYERLRYLEPSEAFRTTFQYNNLMFMTAGVLAETLTGKTWEELIQERIFTPLGMDGANLSVADSQKADDFAQPYQPAGDDEDDGEDDEDGEGGDGVKKVPFRSIDAVGPAGSINAGVADMAKWLALHLADGKAGEREIVSPATLAELHTPRIPVSGPDAKPETPLACYGSGWLIEPYQGHQRIWHNGGIDGFTAQMCFLPHDDLGIVVLANRGGTALPPLVELHVLDRLLDLERKDWSGEALARREAREEQVEEAQDTEDPNRKEGTKPAHKLVEYTGTYEHPAYGSFLVEKVGRKKLRMTFNGLESDLEHFHYEVFRAAGADSPFQGTRVTFRTDPRGNVGSLLVQLEREVDEIELHRQAPAEMRDPAYLARLVGEYEVLGRKVTVRIIGERTLAARVQGQPEIILVPYREDEFDVKDRTGTSARFQLPKKGPATGFQFIQPEGVFEATRVEEE